MRPGHLRILIPTLVAEIQKEVFSEFQTFLPRTPVPSNNHASKSAYEITKNWNYIQFKEPSV